MWSAGRCALPGVVLGGPMPELTQQVLVEPEPTRLVAAADGAGWFGIDPSTKRVSISYIVPDGRQGVITRSFPTAQGPRRLAFIYAETHSATMEATGFHHGGWPGYVLIEQPSGKSPNPNLVYAVGAIQAAVYAALHNAKGDRPCPVVETVPSASWKSLGIGPGWQKLDKAAGDILELARENGYRGSSLDEADAWFIAKAARRTVRFG